MQSRFPVLFFFLSFSLHSTLHAQQCDKFPADCPVNVETEQDSDCCLNNFIISQEIIMQNGLRKQMTEMMEAAAKTRKWQVYQYTESTDTGIGNGNAKPLLYPFRGPHSFSISFIFIVNQDSLAAWQNWYNNELAQRAYSVVDSYNQAGKNDNTIQNYADSAIYYGNLKTKYMTDNAASYQKAILASDQKAIKKYEDGVKKYDDKVTAFMNKASGKKDENYSSANSEQKDLQTYKQNMTIAFRNASMIRIKIDFNYGTAVTSIAEDVKTINHLSIPATSFAVMLHNNQPSASEVEVFDLNQFIRSPDFAMLLFGKWILKEDEYHSYHAVYTSDKKNMDHVTIKKIPCDKVQTIVMHVEGSTHYINQFLQSFDLQKLNSVIIKE